MNGSTAGGLANLSYPTARRLLIVAGLVILLVTAGVMYARRVDTVEVVAVLLFMPIFLAFVFWQVIGGLVAGVLAALAYLFLRLDAIDQVGLDTFRGHLLSRTAAYLAFGIVGGWAASMVEASLTKLDLYDQVDDDTGLFNARFFVQDTELEMARATRYQTLFSVVVVDVPATAFEGLSRRQRAAALKGLGKVLKDSVRTVDRAVHAFDGARHRIGVVLPETAAQGATVFSARLLDWVTKSLRDRGGAVQGVGVREVTYPDDEVALRQLHDEFLAVDRTEHPAAPPPAP
jgi:hypothetical protein